MTKPTHTDYNDLLTKAVATSLEIDTDTWAYLQKAASSLVVGGKPPSSHLEEIASAEVICPMIFDASYHSNAGNSFWVCPCIGCDSRVLVKNFLAGQVKCKKHGLMQIALNIPLEPGEVWIKTKYGLTPPLK